MKENVERGWKWWLGHVIVPILVALIGGAALYLATRDGGDEPRGTIGFPRDGAEVSRSFMAEGTLEDIPEDRHAWLAVQVGNLLFPKEPEIGLEHHWLKQSVEAGDPPGGRFSLVLLTVDPAGQARIERWLAEGVAGGGFAGLTQIPGSTKLDAATDLSLTAPQ